MIIFLVIITLLIFFFIGVLIYYFVGGRGDLDKIPPNSPKAVIMGSLQKFSRGHAEAIIIGVEPIARTRNRVLVSLVPTDVRVDRDNKIMECDKPKVFRMVMNRDAMVLVKGGRLPIYFFFGIRDYTPTFSRSANQFFNKISSRIEENDVAVAAAVMQNKRITDLAIKNAGGEMSKMHLDRIEEMMEKNTMASTKMVEEVLKIILRDTRDRKRRR